MQQHTIFGTEHKFLQTSETKQSSSVKPVMDFYFIEKSVGEKIKGYLLM